MDLHLLKVQIRPSRSAASPGHPAYTSKASLSKLSTDTRSTPQIRRNHAGTSDHSNHHTLEPLSTAWALRSPRRPPNHHIPRSYDLTLAAGAKESALCGIDISNQRPAQAPARPQSPPLPSGPYSDLHCDSLAYPGIIRASHDSALPTHLSSASHTERRSHAAGSTSPAPETDTATPPTSKYTSGPLRPDPAAILTHAHLRRHNQPTTSPRPCLHPTPHADPTTRALRLLASLCRELDRASLAGDLQSGDGLSREINRRIRALTHSSPPRPEAREDALARLRDMQRCAAEAAEYLALADQMLGDGGISGARSQGLHEETSWRMREIVVLGGALWDADELEAKGGSVSTPRPKRESSIEEDREDAWLALEGGGLFCG